VLRVPRDATANKGLAPGPYILTCAGNMETRWDEADEAMLLATAAG
jgi:hypothetical protein